MQFEQVGNLSHMPLTLTSHGSNASFPTLGEAEGVEAKEPTAYRPAAER